MFHLWGSGKMSVLTKDTVVYGVVYIDVRLMQCANVCLLLCWGTNRFEIPSTLS